MCNKIAFKNSIIGKSDIRNNAIFEINLVTHRSKSAFKGYQQTFPDFLEAMASNIPANSGGVNVNLVEPAVDQVWSEIVGIICSVTEMMKPFLHMSGIEEGNGLSPFAE